MKEFLALLPPGLRAFALYVHAHRLYLDGDYARSLGVIEAALMGQAATYPIPEIYLRLAASMDYMALRKPDEAREQLLIAWHIAQPDGLVEAFGEHHGLLGGLLEATLQQEWPDESADHPPCISLFPTDGLPSTIRRLVIIGQIT